MKTQQQHGVTYSSRKGAIRSRPGARWMDTTEEIDFARSSQWNPAMRDGSQDINSVASVHKIASLLEVFPEVSAEVMEDVLIAAQFRLDIAASMLSELIREAQSAQGNAANNQDADWESDVSDMADEQWFDLNESHPELQQWVVVQDEWELVDDLTAMKNDQPTLSYADVLRTASPTTVAYHQKQPLQSSKLTTITSSTSRGSSIAQQKCGFEDAVDWSEKALGARKRRFMRKYRS